MKYRPLTAVCLTIICLFVLFIGFWPRLPKEKPPEPLKDFSPVGGHQAESLDPVDIGIYKFVFEVTPPPGKAMVLRWTKYVEGRPPEVRETVHINTYRPTREEVILFNSAWFPFNPDPARPSMIMVKANGQEYHLPPGLQCTVVRSDAEPLAFHFSNGERWVYKCFIEDYKTVKARIPKLPEAPTNGGWSSTSGILPN